MLNIQDGCNLQQQQLANFSIKILIIIKVKVKRCPEMKSVKNYNFHKDLRDN